MDKKNYFIEEKEINHNIIHDGLKQSLIIPYLDPDGLKARIGEYWFYFGGSEFENTKPEDIDPDTLKDEIKIALDSFKENKESQDEYMYYSSYLIENLQEDIVFENEPVYLVTYDNKGLSETNFIATKNDLIKDHGIEDFDFSAEGSFWHTYYVAANKTYDIKICHSVNEMAAFFEGNFNTDVDELIANNFSDGDYDGSYDDFYWCNEPNWCGKEALNIAKLYALNADNINIQRTILMELGIVSVERKWSSVTQGEAIVVVEGKPVVQFADELWLQSKDKTCYTKGHFSKNAEKVKFFKENTDGWGSINSDTVFITAALKQFPEKIKEVLLDSLKKNSLDEKINGVVEKQMISERNKISVEELKNSIGYSFECNMTEEYESYEIYDEWGCAYVWFGGNRGAEYNFCIDELDNYSAFYKMELNEKTGYMETDYDSNIHYEIDFNESNWKEKLENAMCEALIKYFNLENVHISSLADAVISFVEESEARDFFLDLLDSKNDDFNKLFKLGLLDKHEERDDVFVNIYNALFEQSNEYQTIVKVINMAKTHYDDLGLSDIGNDADELLYYLGNLKKPSLEKKINKAKEKQDNSDFKYEQHSVEHSK